MSIDLENEASFVSGRRFSAIPTVLTLLRKCEGEEGFEGGGSTPQAGENNHDATASTCSASCFAQQRTEWQVGRS